MGNSDSWKSNNRGTNGIWYKPEKPGEFKLAVSYKNGMLTTYINGLIDQSIDMGKLTLTDVLLGGFKGTMNDVRIYNRALSQDEIKAIPLRNK